MHTCGVPDRAEPPSPEYQVLIIGGGMSGTVAATVLGQAGYSVCLIDRHTEYPRDFRAEHLDGSMIDVLVRLNLLGPLTSGLYKGETVHLARHGHVVGAAQTTNFGLRYETLVNRARSTMPPNVHMVTGRVADLRTTVDRQSVVLSDGRVFFGKLVIMATGQGYNLCRNVGIKRRVLRDAHSLTFGFNIEPVEADGFPYPFLVYQRERIEDRIDYFAAFVMGAMTRVNLFTYKDYKAPWTKAFIANPSAGLREVLPGLEAVLGRYRAVGPVEARPIDLYVSDNTDVDGVVLVGDAFQSSCPATGTGMLRLLIDIEQLTRIHIPAWFATPGMTAAKIASFYQDPVKQACDAKALHDSEYRRQLSTNTSLGWRAHRVRVAAVERVQAWRNQLPTARHPRIATQAAGGHVPLATA